MLWTSQPLWYSIKIDAYNPAPFDETDLMNPRTKAHYSLQEWKATWMSKIGDHSLFISALNKENLEEFEKEYTTKCVKSMFSVFLTIIFCIQTTKNINKKSTKRCFFTI